MPENIEYLFMGVGALGAVLLASYMPSIVTPAGMVTVRRAGPAQSLYDIDGIDVQSLNIAIQKGMM